MNLAEKILVTPYQQVTGDIKVSVMPENIQEESDQTQGVFVFSYTIRIENGGTETVQLLERYWLVFSGGARIAEIVGPGVQGGQPVIKPGEHYEYQSNAIIKDPIGSMKGEYTFRSEEGKFFQVGIPSFDLVYPEVYH